MRSCADNQSGRASSSSAKDLDVGRVARGDGGSPNASEIEPSSSWRDDEAGVADVASPSSSSAVAGRRSSTALSLSGVDGRESDGALTTRRPPSSLWPAALLRFPLMLVEDADASCEVLSWSFGGLGEGTRFRLGTPPELRFDLSLSGGGSGVPGGGSGRPRPIGREGVPSLFSSPLVCRKLLGPSSPLFAFQPHFLATDAVAEVNAAKERLLEVDA